MKQEYRYHSSCHADHGLDRHNGKQSSDITSRELRDVDEMPRSVQAEHAEVLPRLQHTHSFVLPTQVGYRGHVRGKEVLEVLVVYAHSEVWVERDHTVCRLKTACEETEESRLPAAIGTVRNGKAQTLTLDRSNMRGTEWCSAV